MKSRTDAVNRIRRVAQDPAFDNSLPMSATTRRLRMAALLFVVAFVASIGWMYLQLQVVRPTKTIRLGARNSSANLDVSPGGDELLTTVLNREPNYATEVSTWKMPECEKPIPLREHSSLLSARYSPCGKYVAIGGDSGIRVVERSTKRVKFRFVVMRPFSDSISFSRDGLWLAATGGATEVHLWNLSNGSGPVIVPARDIHHALFIGEGSNLLIVNRQEGAASLWSAGDSRWINELPLELSSNEVDDVALSSTGRCFAIVERNGSVRVWNAESRAQTIEFLAQRSSNVSKQSICFSADDRLLVVAAVETHRSPRLRLTTPYFFWEAHQFTSFKVWDAVTGRLVRQWISDNWHHRLRPIAGTAQFASISVFIDSWETGLNFWSLPNY